MACAADICAGIKRPRAESLVCPAVEVASQPACPWGLHCTMHGTVLPEQAMGVNCYRKKSNLAPARRDVAGSGPLEKERLTGLKACAWTWEESRLKHSDAASPQAAPALPLHITRA